MNQKYVLEIFANPMNLDYCEDGFLQAVISYEGDDQIDFTFDLLSQCLFVFEHSGRWETVKENLQEIACANHANWTVDEKEMDDAISYADYESFLFLPGSNIPHDSGLMINGCYQASCESPVPVSRLIHEDYDWGSLETISLSSEALQSERERVRKLPREFLSSDGCYVHLQ